VSVISVSSHISTSDKHKFPLVKIFVDITLIFIKRDAIKIYSLLQGLLEIEFMLVEDKILCAAKSSPILCKAT